MKIAFLSAFYPYRGGIAQFNGALFRALEKKYEIKAYTFTRQYPEFLFPGATQFIEENDDADKIPSKRILDSINPFSYRKTVNEIIKYQPDLVLTDIWMPFFAPSLGYIAGRLKKKNIITLGILSNVKPHESKPGDSILMKYYLKRHHAFIVLAEAVKNDLLALKPDAVYIKHPHPNYEHFGKKILREDAKKAFNIDKDKKVILFFGLIRKYKGLDILLEAMQGMSDEYNLLIAGEVYGSEEYYLELIKKYKLEKKTLFINKYLSDNEVAPLFSAADVCVLPYRTATQSGIVGIAYHFGVPVISTDVGGLKEMIEPFNTGIVLPEAVPTLLNNAILRFFNENLGTLFEENIYKFKEKYSWDSLGEEIIKLYKSIKDAQT